MPLKNEPNCLGESRDIALKRLNALWARLIRDPQYLKFIVWKLQRRKMERTFRCPEDQPSGDHLTQDIATTGVQKGYKEFERKIIECLQKV
ncbi:UNVERIFIED_CONTAM: hypothetical protein NCL1_30681 [Trichonephila clavipes]